MWHVSLTAQVCRLSAQWGTYRTGHTVTERTSITPETLSARVLTSTETQTRVLLSNRQLFTWPVQKSAISNCPLIGPFDALRVSDLQGHYCVLSDSNQVLTAICSWMLDWLGQVEIKNGLRPCDWARGTKKWVHLPPTAVKWCSSQLNWQYRKHIPHPSERVVFERRTRVSVCNSCTRWVRLALVWWPERVSEASQSERALASLDTSTEKASLVRVSQQQNS